jgi:5' nucleotidase, deoxy (Pyrimidine), cytosolic type C protein (NT5C)
LRIGVDLDGVCYDFADSLRIYLARTRQTEKYTVKDGEVDKWHFYLDWGMTVEDFLDHCHKGADLGIIFALGKPRDAAQDAISFMKLMGHSIHIVTDRSFGRAVGYNSSEFNTKKWLNSYEIEYDSLTFSADKTCVPTDIFIEDKLENYDCLVAAGVDCYLVNRPWNESPGDSRKRVNSIQEFATIVGNIPG